MNVQQSDPMQGKPASTPSRRKKLIALAALAVAAVGALLVEGYRDLEQGPTPEEAFKRMLCDPIPASVKNLKRLLYVPSLDGPRIALGFEIAPEDFDRVFPGRRFAPLYSVEDGFAKGSLAELVEDVADAGFIDLKSALFMTDSGSTEQQVVVSADRRKAFVHHDARRN